MDTQQTFLIFDHDERRRAELSYKLCSSAHHAMPFSKFEEYGREPPELAKVLVYDDGQAVTRLKNTFRSVGFWRPIIAYSENPAPDQVTDAINDGASEYVSWPIDFEYFAARLLKIDANHQRLTMPRYKEVEAIGKIRLLSPRELDVLHGVSNGLSNKEIARELHISPRTVEIHRANMMKKTDSRRSSEVVRIAVEAGPGFQLG